MKKLTIKELVEFRGKSDRGKRNFVTSLKITEPQSTDEGGGDYWISCVSAISNSYKAKELRIIINKRKELEKKHKSTQHEGTKKMYERNIGVLNGYEDFDIDEWIPKSELKFLRKHKSDFILKIKGLYVKAAPHHVYTFQENGTTHVGAIWFIAKLKGFSRDDLGMFTDGLYRYLKTHYSKEGELNTSHCVAVDVINNREVSYAQLESGEVSKVLTTTLDEINTLL